MNNILQLTGLFSLEWKDNLETATEGELADAINSIVSNRHNLAHGRDVGVSLVYMKSWYEKATKVIKLIEDLCDNS